MAVDATYLTVRKRLQSGSAQHYLERSKTLVARTTPTDHTIINAYLQDLRDQKNRAATSQGATADLSDMRTDAESNRAGLVSTLKQQASLPQAEAERRVDLYIRNNTLESSTNTLARQNALTEAGATPGNDTTFVVDAAQVKNTSYEDIVLAVQGDGKSNALRTIAHRPGVQPPTQDDVEGVSDIFNDYKFKTDQDMYATLQVLRPRPTSTGAQPSGETRTDFEVLFETNEFLLQATSEPRSEKFQIVETFGDPFLFTFGARQDIFTYAGVLMNTNNFQWKNKFEKYYEEQFRASKTVFNGARVYLAYDDVLRVGHVLNSAVQQVEQNLNFVQFTFSMFIISRHFMGNAGDLDTEGLRTLDDRNARSREAQSSGPTIVYPGTPFTGLPENKIVAINSRIATDMLDSDGNLKMNHLEIPSRKIFGSPDHGSLFNSATNMGIA